MLTLEETIELILKHKSEYEREDILKMIKEKRNELGPDVINDESAAMIVARELGVDLVKISASARQKIEDINETTKNVAGLVGRVDRIGEVRTFTRKDDNSEGRVASIFISDETGSIRVALWDDMTRAISEGHLSVGSIIQIRGAYVKMGLRNTPELNIGRLGTIKPLENDEIEELGIDFDEISKQEIMKISSLQEGTYDISLKVEIQRVFKLSTFTRKDGTEGKVISMVVADDSGSTRLVFWDDKADLIKDAKSGEVIQIDHAYTRPNRDGSDIEVHVGRSTTIERDLKEKIDTADVVSPYLSSTEPLGKKDIADLTVEMRDVDIEGKIAVISDVRTFTRQDGTEGRVQNIEIADETSSIRVTFWGDDIDEIAEAKEGDVIRILHGYVKEGFRGGVEYQVGRNAEITLNPKDSDLKQLDLSKITESVSSSGAQGSFEPLGKKDIVDLTVEMRDVDIEGKVVTAYDVKTFTRKDGTEGRLRNVIIADPTSKIRVTFWGDDVDTVEDIQEGDVIRILHGYVKEGFRGGVEYQVGRNGEIVLNPKDSDLKQLDISDVSFETVPTKASRILIGEIDESYEGKNVEVCGIIVDMGQNRVYYDACPTCNKKLESTDDGYTCKSCGKVAESEPRMLYKITIDDGSGSIRATLFGTVGEKLLGMTAEKAKDLVSKSGKEDEPIRASTEEIRGRYIAMHGRVKKFGDSLEISSNGFDFADPVEEIKRLKEVIQKEIS